MALRKFARGTAIALAVSTLGGGLAACGGEDNDSKKTPVYDRKENVGDFLGGLYKSKDVTRCIGKASLRGDGHVRTAPYALEGGAAETELGEYSNSGLRKINITLVDPHLVKVTYDQNYASKTWYIEQLPNGNAAFINKDAVRAAEDSFKCEGIATPQDPPGTLLVQQTEVNAFTFPH